MQQSASLIFCMPCRPVSSDGVALRLVTAVQSGFGVWGGLARSGGIWVRWSLVWYWLPVKGDSTMTIRIGGGAMLARIGNRVIAAARFSEHASATATGRGSSPLTQPGYSATASRLRVAGELI
jgi:hypothetical protein